MKNEKSRSACQLLLCHSSRFPLSLVRCPLSVSVHKCVCGSSRVEFLCLLRFWFGLSCLCLRFFYILVSFLASFAFLFFVFVPLFALFALAQLLLLLVSLSPAALGHVASCCDNDNNNYNSNSNKNNSSWQLLSV